MSIQKKLAFILLMFGVVPLAVFAILAWGLVVKMDRLEAFDSIAEFGHLSLLIGLVSVLSLIGASLLVSRFLTRPVRILTQRVRMIGSEDSDYGMGSDGEDEMGQLAVAFERITADLRAVRVSRDDLDLEVSERKRAEERIEHLNSVLRALREVDQVITQEKERDRLIQRVCEVLINTRGYYNAWIAVLDDSARFLRCVQAGLGDKVSAIVERMQCHGLTECAQKAISQQGVVLIQDPAQVCRDCPLSDNYQDRGAMSRRLEYNGRLFGLLTVSIPRRFSSDKEEHELFTEVTNDIAFGLHDIELEEKQRQAEKSIREHQEQLYQAQKMEALGTLVAGLAHEINNPVNLITMNLPLFSKIWKDALSLIEQHHLEEPDRKYGGLSFDFLNENLAQLLSDTERAAVRISGLVGDLRDFARKSGHRDKEPISINAAVKNALRLAETTIRKAGAHVEADLQEGLPLIEGILQSIEQIVLNLVINALESIDCDRGSLNVVTGWKEEEQKVFLSVSDNGRGVEPEVRDRIYDAFVTTKKAEGGLGLGLSITRRLVEVHDGEIGFQSEPGKGTKFTVLFPHI